jgi:hypothetical protein
MPPAVPLGQQLWSEKAATAAVLWLRILGLSLLQLEASQKGQQPAADGAEVVAAAQQQGRPLHGHTTSMHEAPGRSGCSYHLAIDCVNLKGILGSIPLAARLAAQGYDVAGIAEHVSHAAMLCDQM